MEVTRSVPKIALAAVFATAFLILGGDVGRAATASDYRIRPNDTLSVVVYGEQALTQNSLRVLPGGTISMPLAGDVRVAGLTPPDASNAVAYALARYLRHPKVTVAVVTPAPMEVLVLGNVKTPGKFQLQPEARLTDAIAAAGGLGPTDGPLPYARMQTGDGRVAEISLQRLLQQGDVTLNYPVQDRMTVYVISPLPVMVQVFGAVEHPGDVTLHEGDRLIAAIARAGAGPNGNPDLNRVQVRRTQLDGSVRTYQVNVYDVLRSRDQSRDIVLQKGDVVFVPQSAKKQDFTGLMSSLFFWLIPKP